MEPTLTPEQTKALGAFTPAQITSYNRFRATGFSPEKSLSLVLSPTPTRRTEEEKKKEEDGILFGKKSLLSSITDGAIDLGEGFQNVANDAERFGNTQALIQSPIRVLAGLSRGVGTVIGGVLETADDLTGEVVSGALMPPLTSVLQTETAQDVIGYLDRVNQKGRGLPGDILEILTAVAGTQLLKGPIRGAIAEGKAVIRGAGAGEGGLSSFLRPVVRETAEEVVENVPRSADYLYHGTFVDNLDGIKNNGIFASPDDPAYFTSTLSRADQYSGTDSVILRVNKNNASDFVGGSRGDDIISYDKVPPEHIEISIDGGKTWVDNTGKSVNPAQDPTVPATLTATGAIRETAEALAPKLTLGERAIGITADVKGRLQEAGEDLTRQYIDIAKTRNVTDTIIDVNGNRIPAPTPYGFAAQRAEAAATELQRLASETGSVIGKTRERLSTYRATIDQMSAIEKRLVTEIESLNLTIVDGKVVRTRGIQSVSDGDVKAIQTIYKNLKVVKESQNLTDLIEFRSAVDQNIKFGKRASEVSDAIDPLSRALRGEIAEVAAKIVGKTEAAELAKFSDFMDALADLRSFTDRRAGGEYLLRLVSSGRGDEARRLVEVIREYTGIDLMNDATLMTKVTDLIGNDTQKNLFRQEITKAKLDAQAVLSGSPMTMGARAIERTIDWLTDAEQILINASKR